MQDTPTADVGISPDTEAVRMRCTEVDARCEELAGATNDVQRMEVLGLKRATYYRVRRPIGTNLSTRKALQVAGRLGWTVNETFQAVGQNVREAV